MHTLIHQIRTYIGTHMYASARTHVCTYQPTKLPGQHTAPLCRCGRGCGCGSLCVNGQRLTCVATGRTGTSVNRIRLSENLRWSVCLQAVCCLLRGTGMPSVYTWSMKGTRAPPLPPLPPAPPSKSVLPIPCLLFLPSSPPPAPPPSRNRGASGASGVQLPLQIRSCRHKFQQHFPNRCPS
jgi:hypothetical protein